MLTSENMEELVRITSEEMRSAAGKLKERLDIIKAELRGVKARLVRLYGAPETGKLGLDDLSPGIREPRARLAELEETRANVEAEIATGGIGPLDVDLVKKHAHDMRQLLVESGLTERKAFLRSLVRRIETLEEVLRQGKPESFNTDQGPRFTRPGTPTRLSGTGPRPRSLWKPPMAVCYNSWHRIP